MSTAGRREWTRILCSVTASTSRVAAFFGPRFSSNLERLPPLGTRIKQMVPHQEQGKNSLHVIIWHVTDVSLPERQWRRHRLAEYQAVVWRQLWKTHLSIKALEHQWVKDLARDYGMFKDIHFHIWISPALGCVVYESKGTAHVAWSERCACE